MMVEPLGRGFILKETLELASALPPREDIVRRHWLRARKRVLIRTRPCRPLALDFPASRTVRNMSVVYNAPVSGGLV